jgi:hypothetical protein
VIRRRLFCILFVCLLPRISFGQELIGGWEGDATRGYTFGSPVFSFGLGRQSGLVLRGSASYLYYRFPGATGSTDVTSPGAGGALGFRVRARQLSVTLAGGYEERWTTRRPSVGPSLRVTERGMTAQGELFFQATALTNVNAIVSYGEANHYLWARAGLKRQLTNTRFKRPVALAVGVEATGQGNHDGRAYQGGGLVALDFFRARGSLQWRAGYTRLQYPDGSVESRPYFGIGVYRAF